MYAELDAGRMPEKDLVYLTVASIKDPMNRHLAPEGYTNLQVMTLVPREYALWHVEKGPVEAGNAYHVDPEYRRLKGELTERLLQGAERILPGIREHIDWKEAATPITQERFTRSTGGTSYGIELACDQAGPMRMGPETEIPGLYLCGASTPSGHGIGSVLRGGVITAGAVLDTPLLRMINAGEVLGDRNRLPPLREDWDALRECG
jgi:phytoene dehydrogenase-like protein